MWTVTKQTFEKKICTAASTSKETVGNPLREEVETFTISYQVELVKEPNSCLCHCIVFVKHVLGSMKTRQDFFLHHFLPLSALKHSFTSAPEPTCAPTRSLHRVTHRLCALCEKEWPFPMGLQRAQQRGTTS